MSDLRETLFRIAGQWPNIPIRAQKNGKWGSYYLSELDDKTVAEWIRDYVLPKYIGDES